MSFMYDLSYLDLKNLVCFEFIFTNTGITEIDTITAATNYPRTTSLVGVYQRKFYIDLKMLNYSVYSNVRFIKQGQKFKLRVFFHKDHIIDDSISASISIFMQDINGNYWCQPLFVLDKNTENSKMITYQDYRNRCDADLGIKCFRGDMFC